MAEWLGLMRSLIVYWRPGRQRGLRGLYAPFVREGDVVFDVGAHLGDRSVAFAALGATVVAFEPQPRVARWLQRLVRRNHRITVRPEAVGRTAGTAQLSISRRSPTVSTLSEGWRRQVSATNPGFRHVRWEESVEVPVLTLDELIQVHGIPSFCKIDVEGYELEVLGGLTRPLAALSVEFVSGDLQGAVSCVERLGELGAYDFNVVIGERRSFVFDDWLTPAETLEWIEGGADGASSGDLYARLHAGLDSPRGSEESDD